MVYLEAQEPHISVLWGAQFLTQFFAQLTPKDGKVLSFARYIRLGILPSTVVVQSEWLIPEDVAEPQAAEMESLLACQLQWRRPAGAPHTACASARRVYPKQPWSW